MTRDGGRVRHGLLYRSSAPTGRSAAEMAALASLGLRAVYDLRSEPERKLAPDSLPDEVEYFGVDVLAGASGLTPIDQDRIMAQPGAAVGVLRGLTGPEASAQRFVDLVRLPAARRGFGRIFADLADGARTPAMIHCSTGKDRTGWAVAALLSLLDVPRDSVMADYLRSGELLEPVTREARMAFVGRGGDGTLFDSLAGVRSESLEAAFEEVDRTYGSVADYFDRGLGIDASTQRALRTAFVESA